MLAYRRSQNTRVDDGLAGPIRTGRIHGMGGVPKQSHRSVNPRADRIAIDHRIFEYEVCASNQFRHIEPAPFPVGEILQKAVNRYLTKPPAQLALIRIGQGDLSDPVDHRQARPWICVGDRVEDDAMLVRAETHERGTGSNRLGPRHPAPHHLPAPVDGRLAGMHLRPDRRMNAVRPNEQAARHCGGGAVRVGDESHHRLVGGLTVTGYAGAELYGLRTDSPPDLLVEQHLQLTAMNCVLRPTVSRQTTSWL